MTLTVACPSAWGGFRTAGRPRQCRRVARRFFVKGVDGNTVVRRVKEHTCWGPAGLHGGCGSRTMGRRWNLGIP